MIECAFGMQKSLGETYAKIVQMLHSSLRSMYSVFICYFSLVVSKKNISICFFLIKSCIYFSVQTCLTDFYSVISVKYFFILIYAIGEILVFYLFATFYFILFYLYIIGLFFSSELINIKL